VNAYRWDDLAVGKSETFDVEVTSQAMTQFASVSGDYNPLHIDEKFAHEAGFGGVVVFGLLTSSFYSQLVGMYLPGKFALLRGLDIDFKLPVFVGDKLQVTGEIRNLSAAYKSIELLAKIVRISDAKVVSKAVIRVGLHES
jgi:3-hydroxybutyryl-CoA dehydratase